jgi:MFS family permease
MVSTTESSEKAIVQHRFLVPRLSLMMFMQFFIWGSWSVTLGLVMTRYNMSLLIGDAFSAGPIASILSPFVLGMLVDRFFRLAEGDGGDASGRGGDPVVRARRWWRKTARC